MLMARFRKKCGGKASGGTRVWLRVLSFSAEEPEGSVLFSMTPNFMQKLLAFHLRQLFSTFLGDIPGNRRWRNVACTGYPTK